MKKVAIAVSMSLLIFAAVPSLAIGAGESLPTPKSKRVVVPGEIAGIKPGMKLAAARTAWGKKRGQCYLAAGSGACRYGESYTLPGDAEFGVSSGKVTSITVRAYTSVDGFSFNLVSPSLKKMRTKEGFGLGTKLKDIIRKYPKGKRRESSYSVSYEIASGKASFIFSATPADERVSIFGLTPKTGIVIR